MTRYLFLLIFFLTACGDGFENADRPPTVEPLGDGQAQRRLIGEKYLQIVNDHRSGQRSDLLEWNDIMEEIVYRHSRAMGLGTSPFGHSGLNIRCRWIRNRLGLPSGSACGEIVARGQKNYKEVFHSWMNSPAHRKIIENPIYTHSALSFYRAVDGTVYWTQIFIQN